MRKNRKYMKKEDPKILLRFNEFIYIFYIFKCIKNIYNNKLILFIILVVYVNIIIIYIYYIFKCIKNIYKMRKNRKYMKKENPKILLRFNEFIYIFYIFKCIKNIYNNNLLICLL